jgi:hypothetical protein
MTNRPCTFFPADLRPCVLGRFSESRVLKHQNNISHTKLQKNLQNIVCHLLLVFFWFIVFWGRGVSQEGELKNTTQNVDQQKACRFVLPKQNVVFFLDFFMRFFYIPICF